MTIEVTQAPCLVEDVDGIDAIEIFSSMSAIQDVMSCPFCGSYLAVPAGINSLTTTCPNEWYYRFDIDETWSKIISIRKGPTIGPCRVSIVVYVPDDGQPFEQILFTK